MTTTTTPTPTRVKSRDDVPGPGTRGGERASGATPTTTTGNRTAALVVVAIVVTVAAVLAGLQPWTASDEAVPFAPGILDNPAAIFAEKELIRVRVGSAGVESLTPGEERRLLAERAAARRSIAAQDDAFTLRAEKDVMAERGAAGSPAILTPRQEHDLLVGR